MLLAWFRTCSSQDRFAALCKRFRTRLSATPNIFWEGGVRLLPARQSLPALALAAIMAFCPQDARMSQTPADSSALKPCPRCGQPAELVKAGSRRFWVQCSRYPKQGTCSTIAAQADNKKEAIHNWNSRM